MFKIEVLRDENKRILGDKIRLDNGDVIARGWAAHSATRVTVMASL